MRLRTKIIALAAAPLLLALVLVALAVWHQERDLAQRERSLPTGGALGVAEGVGHGLQRGVRHVLDGKP